MHGILKHPLYFLANCSKISPADALLHAKGTSRPSSLPFPRRDSSYLTVLKQPHLDSLKKIYGL